MIIVLLSFCTLRLAKMAAQGSPYVRMGYDVSIYYKGKGWRSIPKLEDLRQGDTLVTGFSAGRLQLAHPILYTQAEKRSFDGPFLGVGVLGELIASDEVTLPLSSTGSSTQLTCFSSTGYVTRGIRRKPRFALVTSTPRKRKQRWKS